MKNGDLLTVAVNMHREMSGKMDYEFYKNELSKHGIALSVWTAGNCGNRKEMVDLVLDMDPEQSMEGIDNERWTVHYGKKVAGDGAKPGMWEVIHGDDVICVRVVREGHDTDNRKAIIKEGYLSVTKHSRVKTEVNVIEAVLRWLPNLLNKYKNEHTEDRNTYVSQPEHHRAMSGYRRFQFHVKQLGSKYRKIMRSAFYIEWWNVGIAYACIEDFIERTKTPKITWVQKGNRNVFRADPFLESITEKATLILYEYFDWRECKGRLHRMEVGKSGEIVRDIELNKVTWHQSYPFLVTSNGNKYCIPESSAANEIQIYDYDETSGRLSNPQTLVAGFPGLDATFLYWNGLWWMFCSRLGGGDSELYLWYASSLHGEWTPHELNPVKVDVRSSRPAGKIVQRGDTLLRPAQDCSHTYGGAIVVNRITKLSTIDYDEEPIGRIEPLDTLTDGVHTICESDGVTVIDGKQYRPSLRPVWNKAKRLLKAT